VARNYVQFFVDGGFPAREETRDRAVLRAETHSWTAAKWSGTMSDRAQAESTGACFGVGSGSFEWEFAIDPDELRATTRIGLLCEASSCREGTPQTDSFAWPTQFRMLLNGVRVYSGILPNHPHDAAGALSYLRNGRGAYGYLAHATVDGDLLRHVVGHNNGNALRLTCLVPAGRKPRGGLTIYGGDCGRSPVPPTIILER
jgi:hypothetical protein